MMTRGGRGVKNAENLMTSYVNDPLVVLVGCNSFYTRLHYAAYRVL